MYRCIHVYIIHATHARARHAYIRIKKQITAHRRPITVEHFQKRKRMYFRMYVCMHVCTCMHAYLNMHTKLNYGFETAKPDILCVQKWSDIHTNTNTHTYIHTNTNTRTYINAHGLIQESVPKKQRTQLDYGSSAAPIEILEYQDSVETETHAGIRRPKAPSESSSSSSTAVQRPSDSSSSSSTAVQRPSDSSSSSSTAVKNQHKV